jgi:hypothetical protein
LYARTAIAAHFAAEGWALNTTALPAATMLMMLPLSVGGRNRADDPEGGVLFQRNAMVAAAGIGMQPFNARNQLDDLELLDLVVQPADLCLLQLDPAPLGGIGFRQGLYDLNHLGPCGDAFLLELEEAGLRGSAGFIGILEDAVFAAANRAGSRVAITAATARFFRRGRRRGGL